MKIAIIGTGYVGLVTGTCLAETGNNVICVDNNEEKVEQLNSGIIPIFEPRLDVLFHRNIQEERLKFTTDLAYTIKKSDIFFLALPTPPGEDGSADLSHVLSVANKIGELISDFKIIVTKSTVPVGTSEKVYHAIRAKTSTDFEVVSNPEFLREGFAVDDFMKPDRIVIGTSSERVKEILSDLYSPYVRQGNPIIFMDIRSAELTKYSANTFLAMKISFMNEIACLCEKTGADVDSIRRGISGDDRIGKRFLFPGLGYGGSCLPKDVMALSNTSKSVGFDFKILEAVLSVNKRQQDLFFERIKFFYKGVLKNKKFALWGLAFKPNTDDIREAPAINLIGKLLQEGVQVYAFDPEAMNNTKKIFGDKIFYGKNHYDILKDADSLIITTEWPVFRTPDFDRMKSLLKANVIFDGRNLFDIPHIERLGFTYYSVGRQMVG